MSTNPQLRLSMANQHNVPKEYVRAIDAQLLPPRVGHNWNDQAFRDDQWKPQQLEGELRGKRVFAVPAGGSVRAAPPPPKLGKAAQQLLLALSATSRNPKGTTSFEVDEEPHEDMTLDDKVLRFYAYFTESAPDGNAAAQWHRKVVITFYLADDTFMIVEPRTVNSGLDGGTLLKRQKVVADYRQREQHPEDEFVSLNFLNVGESVRLNAMNYILYDCDPFTRNFLTMLGVEVGAPGPCPDDLTTSEYGRYLARQRAGDFGMTSQDASAAEAARTARFLRDGGKMLRFFGVMDERGKVLGGAARRLEVVMCVEDGSLAVLQNPIRGESSPGLLLARGWLPKGGSVAKANELTFRHRVNGQREPDIGEADAYYRDVDLDVGVTISILGRSAFLYDCDECTREFYARRYGVELQPAIDVSSYFPQEQVPATKSFGLKRSKVDALARAAAAKSDEAAAKDSDALRFRAMLVTPRSYEDSLRRFTVTFHTDTEEMMVYESARLKANIAGGCLWKRRKAMKPVPKPRRRNELPPTPKPEELPYYSMADLQLLNELVINGVKMRLIEMDEHTATYFSRLATMAESGGKMRDASGDVVSVDHLAALLFRCLREQADTGATPLAALDKDGDGRVTTTDFTAALAELDITKDAGTVVTLFGKIAPNPGAPFLSANDIDRWMVLMEVSGNGRRHSLLTESEIAEEREKKQQQLRRRVLLALKGRLDARCWKGVDMFRLASTMPRAYRGRRADVYSLSNPDRDTRITPVQLRRCIEEILGGLPTTEELNCILAFFFPSLPPDDYTSTRDAGTTYSVDLNEFQRRYHAMTKETMLPSSDPDKS